MSSILDPLVARLRKIPFSLWESVAVTAGVAPSLPRKLAYGDRENPGVLTIQPLVDYLDAVETGKRPPIEAPLSEHAISRMHAANLKAAKAAAAHTANERRKANLRRAAARSPAAKAVAR